MNKLFLYKLFIMIVIISPFIGFFSRSGVITYGVVILVSSIVVFSEFIKPSSISFKDWIAFFLFLPYVTVAGTYYLINPLGGEILSHYFLTIILTPLFIFIFLRLRFLLNLECYNKLILKTIFIFLIGQFIVCLGQISTYLYGIGFSVSDNYNLESMVTGTYYNANDLAVIIMLISLYFSRIDFLFSKKIKILFWLIAFILLVMVSSRSALVLTVFIYFFSRKINIMNYIGLIFGTVVGFFIISALFVSSGEVSERIVSRLETLKNIYENGIISDQSIALRVDSYIHFLNNLNNLGLGSGKINNYYQFSGNSTFDNLLFQNPHSLIVELGYWLGWVGLISFIIAYSYLIITYKRSLVVFFVSIISMFISSSVIGSYIYFFFLFLLVLSLDENELKYS